MEDYKAKDGTVLVKKGRSISASTASNLVENGITEVRVGPRYAAEIACAQLCGLGHYRMKGYLTIDTEEQYEGVDAGPGGLARRLTACPDDPGDTK